VNRFSCNVPVITVAFWWKTNFLGGFFKIRSKYQNFTKIRPAISRVLPRGRTDITKVTVAFRNLATVSENQLRRR